MQEVAFKYMKKAERDALKDSDFGYVKGKRRLFPIVVAADVLAASKLIGRAKGLSESEIEAVKKKIKSIAKKKGFPLPKDWNSDKAKMSESEVVISFCEVNE